MSMMIMMIIPNGQYSNVMSLCEVDILIQKIDSLVLAIHETLVTID